MIKKYMRMLSKLSKVGADFASRFVSHLRRYRLPGGFGLAPPHADSLVITLDVDQRASLDGANNQPSSSEEVISGSQREIVDHHRRLHDRARRKVKKLSTKLLVEARRVDLSAVTDCLRDIPSKCQNRIDRVLADFDSKLKLLLAQEKYEKECADENPVESQDDESGRFAAKATFFVMMLAAAGLASLALGSDILWGGGAGALLKTEPAIMVGVIAVMLPFLIAVGVSKPVSAKLNHDRPAFRLAMLLTTALLGLVAFSCAHLVIVFANSSVTSEADIFTAINAMTSDPGAIMGDVNAFRGFGIVMGMGLIGFWLGNLSINTVAQSDSRASHFDARRVREKLTRQVRKQVNAIVDAAENDVDKSEKRVQKQFKKLSRLVEQGRDTQAIYDDFVARLEESCNLLLERYREANAAARTTNIPPSFSEQICFRLEGASRKSFFEDGIERHRQTDNEMMSFSETVAKVRSDLRKLNRDVLHSLGAVEAREETEKAYVYT
jgi:hypothetical protein